MFSRESWYIVLPSLKLDDVSDRILWFMYNNRRWCGYVEIFENVFPAHTSAAFELPFRDAIAKLISEDLIVEKSDHFVEITNKAIRIMAEIPHKHRQKPLHYLKKAKRVEKRYDRFKEWLIFGNAIATLALAGWQGWDSYQEKHKKAPATIPTPQKTATQKPVVDSTKKHDTLKH